MKEIHETKICVKYEARQIQTKRESWIILLKSLSSCVHVQASIFYSSQQLIFKN